VNVCGTGTGPLWTGTDEDKWIGWLSVADDQLAQVDGLTQFAAEIKKAGYHDALLLGMGGSSLAPDVLRRTFGRIAGFPELHVLDSTDPAQIAAIEQRVDLTRTLCIVSSKSGSTLEPNIFLSYFFARVAALVGEREAGTRFIAITDPGSNLEKEARRLAFSRVFFGVPSIGGRYSALSSFGIVPAALMGLDVGRFLRATVEMANACGPTVAASAHPGALLGTALGVLAARGRDKLTFIASAGIDGLGAWLEQLIAESTGKSGLGLIPVDGETPAPAAAYGHDRVFAYLRSPPPPTRRRTRRWRPWRGPGTRWSASAWTSRMRSARSSSAGRSQRRSPAPTSASTPSTSRTSRRARSQPARSPTSTNGPLRFQPKCPSLPKTASRSTPTKETQRPSRRRRGPQPTLPDMLRAHLARIGDGDYFALLAYLEMSAANDAPLQRIRHAVRDARGTATCVGFGPRFLHSTGQAYKGGPNTGVFLQITCDDAADLPVPGRRFTFGVVKAAQARGDFQVLAERERRALRVHLGADVGAGLAMLQAVIARGLERRRS
jgi:hypothetical protein